MRVIALRVALGGALLAVLLGFSGRVGGETTITIREPAPPLAEEQLKQLKKVDAWQIEYHRTRSYDAFGLGTGGSTTTGSTLTGWNVSAADREKFDATVIVAGSPGCEVPSWCIADYEAPGRGDIDTRFDADEELDFSDCVVNDDGTRSPGHQSSSVTTFTSGHDEWKDVPGHEFEFGIFGLRYETNPPRAEAHIDTPLVGAGEATSTFAGCIANDAISRSLRVGPGIEFFHNDDPSADQGGDTQVRVENGEFVIRSKNDVDISGDGCPTGRKFLVCEPDHVVPITEHIHTEWVIRPYCTKRDLSELNGADMDGDTLPDCWEKLGFDADGDGKVDVDLPAMGADPLHKDVFVEIDSMDLDKLDDAAIDMVEQAFADGLVPNPDGVPGISLHVDNGPGSTMNPRTGAKWGTLSESNTSMPPQPVLGSFVPLLQLYLWGDFDEIKAREFSSARQPVFHYALSVDRYGSASNSSTGISRGLVPISSSDFIVALGHVSLRPLIWQAGTFMHELGHNLGLHHGGGDSLNYKPNYLSVMNYAFTLEGLFFDGKAGKLDYSGFGPEALRTLDEPFLDEAAGFRLSPPLDLLLARYETLVACVSGKDEPLLSHRVPLTGPQDWNCDGKKGGLVINTNINGDQNIFGFDIYGPLRSYDDWGNLVYDGGAIGDLGTTVELPAETPADEGPIEQLIRSARLLAGDSVPPTTTAVRVPEPNGAGWNRSDVTVTLGSADEGASGVKEVVVRAAGAQPIAETVVSGNSATIVVTAEGETTITYFARDNAGNAEQPKMITIRLDKTGPVVICAATPNVLWPPNHKLVDITVAVSVADQLSGAVGFELAAARSSEPQGAEPDVYGFVQGTSDTSGRLRAERDARGPGRVYSLTYRGLDRADNSGFCTATVAVPHDRGG